MFDTQSIPTIPGTPYGGGFFVDAVVEDGRIAVLIVAPRAEGEGEDLTWKKAVEFCRSVSAGGHDDWRAPDRYEAMRLFQNLGQDNASVDAFKEGGAEAFARDWYWSSTEFDSFLAWGQVFADGLQTAGFKVFRDRARVVRKVLI